MTSIIELVVPTAVPASTNVRPNFLTGTWTDTTRAAAATPQQAKSRDVGLASARRKIVREYLNAPSLESRLFDRRADFKIHTAQVAMHLDQERRARLFKQLDSLMSADDWDPADAIPSGDSFNTLLRLILLLKPGRGPGLSATGNGDLIATWTNGEDRLSIECRAKDHVRWVLSCRREPEEDPDTAAGTTLLHRIVEYLAPYRPLRWFAPRAQQVPS